MYKAHKQNLTDPVRVTKFQNFKVLYNIVMHEQLICVLITILFNVYFSYVHNYSNYLIGTLDYQQITSSIPIFLMA